MTTAEEKKRLRSLHKQAAEMLMDDSRLWDGLNDEQAGQLLKWGVAQMKRLLPQGVNLSEDEVEAWLDKQVTAVGNMMTEVKELTPELAKLDAASLKNRVNGLLDNLQTLTGEAVKGREQNWLRMEWTKWDATEAFRQLLLMLGFDLDNEDA
ncbi:MAG: hypothetical protein KC423_24880 [Anaerolineales bacterium]|nr:hypothetical protein [Anaerolineales bacterium]MCB9432978.1 hypothetical protein [Ardenticatenaceae bacterium]